MVQIEVQYDIGVEGYKNMQLIWKKLPQKLNTMKRVRSKNRKS